MWRIGKLSAGVFFTSTCFATSSLALPDLYETAASNGRYPIFTLYKDHSDPNIFYYPIDAVEIVNEGGRYKFLLSHWGITSPDIDGTGANLTFSARPIYNLEAYQSAISQIRQGNPGAVFAPMPIVESNYELLLDNRFVYGSRSEYLKEAASRGETSGTQIDIVLSDDDDGLEIPGDGNAKKFVPSSGYERVRGGSSTSSQAFTIALERLGARVLASDQGSGGGAIVLRYNYKVTGVGPRLHAKINVDWKKVSEHFQAEAEGSFYSGAVTAGMLASYKKLRQNGGVSLEILDGGAEEDEALSAYVKELYEILTKAYIGGTGLFADQFENMPPPNLPKGALSKAAGWGVSASAFYEKIDQEVHSTFVVKREETTESWFSVGLSLGRACEEGSLEFINLTASASSANHPQLGIADAGNACIPPQSLADFRTRTNACVIQAEASADELAAEGVKEETVEKLRAAYVEACLK